MRTLPICYLVGLDGELRYNNFLRPEMSMCVPMGMQIANTIYLNSTSSVLAVIAASVTNM